MFEDSNETQFRGVDKKARQYGVFRVQTNKNQLYRNLIMTWLLNQSNDNIFFVIGRSYLTKEYLEKIP